MRVRSSSSVSAMLGAVGSSASFSSFDGIAGTRANQRGLSIQEFRPGPSTGSNSARGRAAGQAMGGSGRPVGGTSRAWDWGCLVVTAVVLLTIRASVTPHKQYLQQSDWPHHMYPQHPNTIPSWSVPIISLGVPVAFFLAVYFSRRDGLELNAMLLGALSSVIYCALLTDVLKRMVGRPRPDFMARCYPDRSPTEIPESGYPQCTGDPKHVMEGMQSFPSGHTSWCTAGLAFVSLWLVWHLDPGNAFPSSTWRLWLSFFPTLCAVLIGVSRFMDYWHHWTDVATGFVLGLGFAWFSFRAAHNQLLRQQQELRESKGKQPIAAEDDPLMLSP